MYKYFIMICCLISACNFKNEEKKNFYYPNGGIEKIIEIIDNKTIATTYDSLGRKTYKETLREDLRNGNYIEYVYLDDYNMESHGDLINGEKVKLLNKYFSQETGKLKKEKYFIKVISSEGNSFRNTGDTNNLLYYDNIIKMYSDSLTVIDEASCYFSLQPEDGILNKENNYELQMQANCFDFNKIVLITGEYGQYFNRQGTKFDTIKKESNLISFKFPPSGAKEFVLLGKVFVYKEVIENGEELWQGRHMYFRKKIIVEP